MRIFFRSVAMLVALVELLVPTLANSYRDVSPRKSSVLGVRLTNFKVGSDSAGAQRLHDHLLASMAQGLVVEFDYTRDCTDCRVS